VLELQMEVTLRKRLCGGGFTRACESGGQDSGRVNNQDKISWVNMRHRWQPWGTRTSAIKVCTPQRCCALGAHWESVFMASIYVRAIPRLSSSRSPARSSRHF